MARAKRYRHVDNGSIIETDVIVCDRDEWGSLPQSQDSAWLPAPFGRRLLVAVRVPKGVAPRISKIAHA